MSVERWFSRAERIRDSDGYTYTDFARNLVDALGWTAAADIATALRGHVYGWTGGHALHAAVRPLYDRLGWEQSALVCAWFRNLNNRPRKRAPGWPGPMPVPSTPERSESP